jgi:putative SOS response-associated peptidase YedK
MPVVGAPDRNSISLMTWGLIPSWIKGEMNAGEIRMKTFNARAESIDSKTIFLRIIPYRTVYYTCKGIL